MINIYKLSDELLVERDEEKRGKIIKKLNKTVKKNLSDLLENSEERYPSQNNRCLDKTLNSRL